MFTFFKETFTLIRLLFTSRPKAVNEPELLQMKYYPARGYKYMMWCGKMIYRSEYADRILGEVGTKTYERSKNHETIHLRQAQIKGSWFSYYISYLYEWIKGNPFTSPYKSAYYTIPYEMEAYANEDDHTYPDDYDGSKLHFYDITSRKKTYKKYGDSYTWKIRLKELKERISVEI